MRIRLEIPDDLYRKAEIHAAREDRRIKDLVSDGLRIVLGLAPVPKRGSSKRMMKPPVSIRKGNEIPALTNDAMARLLYQDGETGGF